MPFLWFPSPFWIAVILCLLNLPKPLVVDDAAYYQFAQQSATSPLDPYGFTILWYQWPQRAFEVLAPPALPAWWGLGIRCLGDHPILWKLWLFPFCWMLTASLDALFRRFCKGLERPLTAMIALSPLFLPALNLMLDVPALAWTLSGCVMAFRAVDQRSYRVALLAGILLGIGMETKYTAFVGPVVVAGYGVIHRVNRFTLSSALLAVGFFVGTEYLLSLQYGDSHFRYHAETSRIAVPEIEGESPSDRRWRELQTYLEEKAKLVVPLFGYFGGLGIPIAMLGCFALRVGNRWIYRIAGTVVLGWLMIGALPESWQVWTRNPDSGVERITLNSTIMGIGGGLFFLSVLACASALIVRKRRFVGSRNDWFLIGWFWIELAAYFGLSPFPAARRIMGLYVVSALLTGRLASRIADSQLSMLRFVGWFSIALGVFVASVDLIDGWAEPLAVERSHAWIISQEGMNSKIWYAGHWGFQFYANRLGMRAIHPDESVLDAGDYLVMPDITLRPVGQSISMEPDFLEVLHQEVVILPIPYRSIPEFYGGRTAMSVAKGPRVIVTIYRVSRRWKPQTLFR